MNYKKKRNISLKPYFYVRTSFCIESLPTIIFQFKGYSPLTWILDTRSKTWRRGPVMVTGRQHFGCFHITENNIVTKVVAMGGQGYDGRLSSAEMLDVRTMSWQNLPNLPFKVQYNNGVESVVGPYMGFSIGGTSDSNNYERRIVGLKKEDGNYRWQQVDSLSTGRKYLASVNAPSSMSPSC